MTQKQSKERKVKVKAWAITHADYRDILFLAVPHAANHDVDRNMLVRALKKMIPKRVPTVATPCTITYTLPAAKKKRI